MGKSKESRSNNMKKNIFKVAGCKSLKAKNKAKAVTHDRTKSTQVKNRQKVEDIDKQLSILHVEVRRCKKMEQKTDNDSRSVQNIRTVEMQKEIQRYNEAEENCHEALGKLVTLEM